MKKHDAVLRKTYGISFETLVRRIVKTFDRATPADLEAGASWYPEAGELAADLALQSGRSKQCCAAVISHLSPRVKWVKNVLGAHILLVEKEYMPGLMSRSIEKAQAAIDRDVNHGLVDETTFGNKTARFYCNILGDFSLVTIDVWALRACGLDDQFIERAGVYNAIEYAYQLAARRRSVEPATMQATCWVVARGGRAE